MDKTQPKQKRGNKPSVKPRKNTKRGTAKKKKTKQGTAKKKNTKQGTAKKNKLVKDTKPINTQTFFASVKGERDQNEDCHIITDNGVNFYWGVYDGHGGKGVSDFVSKTLAPHLLSKQSQRGFTDAYITKAHDYVQSALSDDKDVDSVHTGSTSLSMIMTGDKLQIANVGDCRAVLCDGDGMAHALSMDHKPEWGHEQKRIESIGGNITRDQGYEVYRIKNLSVSRSFGDDRHSTYIIHTPDIKSIKIKPTDKFVILACDGLWDIMGSQDAVNFVIHKTNKTNIAKSLCNHAISSGSGDNVTALVVFLNQISL
jgi:serine/threonine protein phosphatase PrpC